MPPSQHHMRPQQAAPSFGLRGKRPQRDAALQASILRRFVAYHIDTNLATLLSLALLRTGTEEATALPLFFAKIIADRPQLLSWQVPMMVLGVTPLIFGLWLATLGWTPGMGLTGLRLQGFGPSKAAPSMPAALIRTYVTSWAWLFFFIPLAVGLFTPGRRHLGDLLSKTQLILARPPMARQNRRRPGTKAPAENSDAQVGPMMEGLRQSLGKPFLVMGFGAFGLFWFMTFGRLAIVAHYSSEGIILGGSARQRQEFVTKHQNYKLAEEELRRAGVCVSPEACFEHFISLLESKDQVGLLVMTTPASRSYIEYIGLSRYLSKLPSAGITFDRVVASTDAPLTQVKVYYQKPYPASPLSSTSPNFIVFTREAGSKEHWQIDWLAYFLEVQRAPRL